MLLDEKLYDIKKYSLENEITKKKKKNLKTRIKSSAGQIDANFCIFLMAEHLKNARIVFLYQ